MAKTARVIELRPRKTRQPAKRRKAADEWRAINRAARVKDGRPVLLAIRDPRKPGAWVTGQAYWHVAVGGWWWSNTGPEIRGTDSISDVYELAGAQWMPMPPAPAKLAA